MVTPGLAPVGAPNQLVFSEVDPNWPLGEELWPSGNDGPDSPSALNTACNGKFCWTTGNGKCCDLSNWAVMSNLKDPWCSIKFGAFPIVGAIGSFLVTIYCTLRMISLVAQKVFVNCTHSDDIPEKQGKIDVLEQDLLLYRKYTMAHLTNIVTLGILFTIEGRC